MIKKVYYEHFILIECLDFAAIYLQLLQICFQNKVFSDRKMISARIKLLIQTEVAELS